MPATTCRICENSRGNTILSAREFMFGSGDRFDYFRCSTCGCVQIAEVPPNLGDYYPADYYSFGTAAIETGIRRWLQRKRAAWVLEGRGLIGRMLAARFGIPETLEHLRHTGTGYAEPVLEAGSGTGERLLAMRAYGFSHLTGVDPYVEKPTEPAPGVRILKEELSRHEGSYGLVMLHHAFEHMDHPHDVLRDVRRLLQPGKTALIRIPLADSLAFETYGADWVQLDAPRHLYLHTVESMKRIVAGAGLEITSVVRDSTAFQFWGSEQYRRGIPLRDPRSYAVNPAGSVFSAAEIEEYSKRASRLNEAGEGDQACFYLRRPVA